MIINDLVIRGDEKIIFALRKLYESRGYSQYKMIKFEEYDLYVRNKDFLASENIITFNDTNGKLMALKPDVTLSIIKNSGDTPEEINKVYYNENVYRVAKSSHSFKEIMQVGLECLGAVDNFCISEVLTLAAQSLKLISDNCVLSVSDLSVITDIIEKATDSSSLRKKLIGFIGDKNQHQLTTLCEEEGISPDITETLAAFTTLHGSPDKIFDELNKLLPGNKEVKRLESIILSLDESLRNIIDIDFSFVGDINYYNGIIFKGFISGIPTGIVSGGQYDKLMKKMGRKSKAIGFAVYLDELERLIEPESDYDADTVILYDDTTDIAMLNKMISGLTYSGSGAAAFRKIPEKFRYRQIMDFTNKEAK